VSYNQPDYKWYVVDVQSLRIESGWQDFAQAVERATEFKREGGVPKVMKQPRVGGLVLDPDDDASWQPKRNNPQKNAEDVYRMWHKKEPHSKFVVRGGCRGDDKMLCVGKAHNIVYRSGKWEKGRKTNDYIHHFDSKPSVYILEKKLPADLRGDATKTVDDLIGSSANEDGRIEVAELAVPLSFGLDDGEHGADMDIHRGAKVYGAVDQRTVIIHDPEWKLIVIKGGRMYFDERGIVY
jgi:hypothetical protein